MMKNSEKIRKEIEETKRKHDEVLKNLKVLNDEYKVLERELGLSLLNDKEVSTKRFDEVKLEYERLRLIDQACSSQLEKLKDELNNALESEKQAELEKLSNQGFEIIKKMLPMILELNKLADELLNLHSAYTVRSGNYRTRAVTQGLPAGAIFAQTDGWLNIAEGAAPKLKAYLLEKGFPNRVERMKIRTEKKGRDGRQK